MPYWTENVQTPTGVPITGLPVSTCVDKNVGFQTKSVIVDNYTTWWIWIKDPDVYIPPYWIGVIRNLDHQTDYVYAQYKSPFTDIQQPAGVQSFFTHFVWTSEVLSPAGGSLLDGFSFTTGGVVFPPSLVTLADTLVLSVPVFPAAAIAIPTTPMVNRRALMLQAAETNADYVYIGGPNVTPSRIAGSNGGVSLAPQQTYPIDADGAIPFAIAGVGGQVIIIQQGA